MFHCFTRDSNNCDVPVIFEVVVLLVEDFAVNCRVVGFAILGNNLEFAAVDGGADLINIS
jgi:hypothetical protein